MLTFWQLTLQCYHHSLTQLHSPRPQFIQNQAPIDRPSHQLYARYHHQWKVYIQCFRKLIFLWTAIVFPPIWTSKQRSDRVLFLYRKEVRFETGFSLAVFSKTMTVEFVEWGTFSMGSVSTTTRNEALAQRNGMCWEGWERFFLSSEGGAYWSEGNGGRRDGTFWKGAEVWVIVELDFLLAQIIW